MRLIQSVVDSLIGRRCVLLRDVLVICSKRSLINRCLIDVFIMFNVFFNWMKIDVLTEFVYEYNVYDRNRG